MRTAKSAPEVAEILRRNLIFVCGKGGVGKTAVSHAIANALSQRGARTLWITLEDPNRPLGETIQLKSNLWHLNCEGMAAFEEYASQKVGIAALARLFLKNKLVRYLAKAAPGIHELVLLGKIWHERENYAHVVVDMPSTGHGLAMFQSTENYSRLFRGGPVHHDAESMLKTFSSARDTGYLIVSLPEEMPLQESLELNDYLLSLFPKNPPGFLVNRLFPRLPEVPGDPIPLPDEWLTPVAASVEEFARKRSVLESYNLRLWKDHHISFGELSFEPSSLADSAKDGEFIRDLAAQLRRRNYA